MMPLDGPVVEMAAMLRIVRAFVESGGEIAAIPPGANVIRLRPKSQSASAGFSDLGADSWSGDIAGCLRNLAAHSRPFNRAVGALYFDADASAEGGAELEQPNAEEVARLGICIANMLAHLIDNLDEFHGCFLNELPAARDDDDAA